MTWTSNKVQTDFQKFGAALVMLGTWLKNAHKDQLDPEVGTALNLLKDSPQDWANPEERRYAIPGDGVGDFYSNIADLFATLEKLDRRVSDVVLGYMPSDISMFEAGETEGADPGYYGMLWGARVWLIQDAPTLAMSRGQGQGSFAAIPGQVIATQPLVRSKPEPLPEDPYEWIGPLPQQDAGPEVILKKGWFSRLVTAVQIIDMDDPVVALFAGPRTYADIRKAGHGLFSLENKRANLMKGVMAHLNGGLPIIIHREISSVQVRTVSGEYHDLGNILTDASTLQPE